jgi:diketogulonate reductase-like aldo/keto reductase
MPLTEMRTIELPRGGNIPVLGQGTWHLGQDRHPPEDEIAALRFGLDLDMNLIDTAEMYGDGRAEELVGHAITGRRDEVFLVSKLLPWHAARRQVRSACHASLNRLKTDRLDLYLLHWRGAVPLEETVAAFVDLQEAGAIRNWGVSNFSLADLEELVVGLPDGCSVSTDQVLYNLVHRGVELDMLPWCQQHEIPVMAYSPIEQGQVLTHHTLVQIAQRHEATPAQIALAWIISQHGLVAIPEAGSFIHVNENRGALDVHLTDEDYTELNHALPAPRATIRLEGI